MADSTPPNLPNPTTTANAAPFPPPSSSSTTTAPSPIFRLRDRVTHAFAHAVNTRRARRQLSIFVAGASALVFSTLITRQAIQRRLKVSALPFYYPSHAPPTQVQFSGPGEAVEAFAMATLNTTSMMAMLVGGMIWGLDVGSLDDLRRRIRGGLGVDGTGRDESLVEEEFEEWMARVLERQKLKDKAAEEDAAARKMARGRVVAETGESVWRNERGKER